MSYRTKGIPFGWELSGAPVPPAHRPALRDPESIGHPGPGRTWGVYEKISGEDVLLGSVFGTLLEDALRLAQALGIVTDENVRRCRIAQETT